VASTKSFFFFFSSSDITVSFSFVVSSSSSSSSSSSLSLVLHQSIPLPCNDQISVQRDRTDTIVTLFETRRDELSSHEFSCPSRHGKSITTNHNHPHQFRQIDGVVFVPSQNYQCTSVHFVLKNDFEATDDGMGSTERNETSLTNLSLTNESTGAIRFSFQDNAKNGIF
jgi:hypothetical protein